MVRRRADYDVFVAIADPTRRAILQRLIAGESSVQELARTARMSQPAFSQHLRVLREAGLVKTTHIGRQRFYGLNPAGLKEVSDWVAAFDRFWEEKFGKLAGYLRRKQAEKN